MYFKCDAILSTSTHYFSTFLYIALKIDLYEADTVCTLWGKNLTVINYSAKFHALEG
jgi:hypothetical protein